MNHSKRHGEILRLLNEEGTISIAALPSAWGFRWRRPPRRQAAGRGRIDPQDARRHRPADDVGEAPFERRMRETADAKRQIARAVATTIRDGKSIMLDTGTTTAIWRGNCSGIAG